MRLRNTAVCKGEVWYEAKGTSVVDAVENRR